MAMVLDISHLGAPKVIALRHLLSVLLINIYFCDYSDTMVQFFFFQYEQSQGYVNKHSKKYILIWLALRLMLQVKEALLISIYLFIYRDTFAVHFYVHPHLLLVDYKLLLAT